MVDIFDKKGKQKPLSSNCLVTKTKKSKTKAEILNFIREIKKQISHNLMFYF